VEIAAPVNPAIAWFVDLETFIDELILRKKLAQIY
jgi:hypothetical protein